MVLFNVEERTNINIFKQFVLLTKKNFIVTLREKIWTFFELLVPLLCSAFIIFSIFVLPSSKSPAFNFPPISLYGNASDVITRGIPGTGSADWCMGSNYTSVKNIAYSCDTPEVCEEAERLMETLVRRYFAKERLELIPKYFSGHDEMEKALRKDVNNTDNICNIHFVAGVFFQEVNITTAQFSYTLLIPHFGGAQGAHWNLDANFHNGRPYRSQPYLMNYKDTYLKSGFITLQKALADEFLKMCGGSDQSVVLQPFPRQPSMPIIVEFLLDYLPTAFAFFMFPTLAHGASELTAETESGIKDFMRVFGLSRRVFYTSHILFMWLKTMIVCLFCALCVSPMLEFISPPVFVLTVSLYALGAAVAAALCASFFTTPATTLRAFIVAWMASSVPTMGTSGVQTTSVMSVISSLNINFAFKHTTDIMLDHYTRETPLNFLTMFSSSPNNFSLVVSLLMIVCDILLMSLAIWMVEELKDGGERILELLYDTMGTLPDFSHKNQNSFNYVETDELRRRSPKGIETKKLFKYYQRTGEWAVKGLDFEAHVDQVTVLLGHNGAGKSTTFSMLCGLIRPTKGEIHLKRSPIGLCPQASALFDKLTVQQHLWFFNELKGLRATAAPQTGEMGEIIKDLDLEDKLSTLAKNLSGGQKRKLCVGMAFIGGSDVVLLDEPTTGMDVETRREVQNVLTKYKTGRTILLSTHYIEEAEKVGDWVYIMYSGRGFANGTVDYLKKKFGDGVVVSVVVQDHQRIESIAEELRTNAERATGAIVYTTIRGRQIDLTITDEDLGSNAELPGPSRSRTSMDRRTSIRAFLQGLEDHQDELDYLSFGLDVNTLEHAFLRAGEEAAKEEEEAIDEMGNIQDTRVDDRVSGVMKTGIQAYCLLRKRSLYALRNMNLMFSQLLLPVLIVFFVAVLGVLIKGDAPYKERTLSLDSTTPMRSFLQDTTGDRTGEITQLSSLFNDINGVAYEKLPSDSNMTSLALTLPKDFPVLGIGIRLSSHVTEALFNVDAYHSLPTALNLAYTGALRRVNNNARITPTVKVYTPPSQALQKAKNIDMLMHFLLAPLLVVAFSIHTSGLVSFLIEERQSRFFHLQRLTECPLWIYWVTSFCFDFLFYSLYCLLLLVVFLLFGWIRSFLAHVLLIFGLFFFASTPFIYLFSYAFSSYSKATSMVLVWQVITAISVSVLQLILPFIPFFNAHSDIVTCMFMALFPPYAMGFAIAFLVNKSYGEDPFFADDIWKWNEIGRPITSMTTSAIIFMCIFVIFQAIGYSTCLTETISKWRKRRAARRARQDVERYSIMSSWINFVPRLPEESEEPVDVVGSSLREPWIWRRSLPVHDANDYEQNADANKFHSLPLPSGSDSKKKRPEQNVVRKQQPTYTTGQLAVVHTADNSTRDICAVMERRIDPWEMKDNKGTFDTDSVKTITNSFGQLSSIASVAWEERYNRISDEMLNAFIPETRKTLRELLIADRSSALRKMTAAETEGRGTRGRYTETETAEADELYNVAFRATGLTKKFGSFRAVDEVNFDIKNLECFGLLGPNGAGKTTIFDMVTKRKQPTEGLLEKNDVLGYCPQFDALLLVLTGRETLEILAGLHGYRNPTKKALQVLKRVGMESKGNNLLMNCSGGQRRRISLAAALVARAPLIVLDEPTAGIDAKARNNIWTDLSKMRQQDQASIMLTSHSMTECEMLCTRVGVLNKGKLAAEACAAPQHLKSQYSPYCVLTLLLDDNSKPECIDYEVEDYFPGAIKISSQTNNMTSKWKVKSDHSAWSSLWKRASSVARFVKAKDFTLTQSPFEDTFLNVAKSTSETGL